MLYLACTIISSVDLAQYGVSLAKDWVSVKCGTISIKQHVSQAFHRQQTVKLYQCMHLTTPVHPQQDKVNVTLFHEKIITFSFQVRPIVSLRENHRSLKLQQCKHFTTQSSKIKLSHCDLLSRKYYIISLRGSLHINFLISPLTFEPLSAHVTTTFHFNIAWFL